MTAPKIKILRYVLSVTMLIFAGLQLNDPDPWRWVLLYGVVAISGLVGSSAHNRGRIGISIAYVCLAYWRFPLEYHGIGEMSGSQPEIEQARESFGILIAAGINAFNIWFFTVEDMIQERIEYGDE